VQATGGIAAGLDVLSLMVAAVFLAAGIGKSISPSGAASFIQSLLSVSSTDARWIARAVAIVELGTVAFLTLADGLLVGHVLALLLGLGIVAVTVRSAATGARPSCGCFGTSDVTKIGPIHGLAGAAIAASSFAHIVAETDVEWDADARLALLASLVIVVTMAQSWSRLKGPWAGLSKRVR
jgi:hypothetical protein